MQERAVSLPDQEAESSGSRAWIKVVLGFAVLVALFFAGREAGDLVTRFAESVEDLGVWGPAAFILGYAVATVAMLPGSLLTLAAGAIFGLLEGVAYVFVGATLGATAAFLLSRTVARGWVERWLEGNDKVQVIDRAVGREGLKIVALMRLSPVFPFNLLNYALGLTRVRASHYVIACLGMIPGTFLYVYVGKVIGEVAAVAGDAGPERGPVYWTVMALGFVATIAVTMVVTRTAKRALSEEVEDVDEI